LISRRYRITEKRFIIEYNSEFFESSFLEDVAAVQMSRVNPASNRMIINAGQREESLYLIIENK